MKRIIYMIVFLTINHLMLFAQFTGGSNDGYSKTNYTNPSASTTFNPNRLSWVNGGYSSELISVPGANQTFNPNRLSWVNGGYARADILFTNTIVLFSPALISPAPNALNQPRNLAFTWSSVSGASSYQIQVSKDATFNSLTVDETVSNTTLTTNLLSNSKTYYWRVKAISGTTVSAWSEVRNFSTQSGNIDLETGLVAYYPFNGNANDESGNGNNGTVNGATLSSDRFGNGNKAYSFDGVDDWIESNIGEYDTISVSLWYNVNSINDITNDYPHLFSYALEINPNSNFEGFFAHLLGITYQQQVNGLRNLGEITSCVHPGSCLLSDTKFQPTFNSYHHLVAVYVPNQTHKLFLDNVLIDENSIGLTKNLNGGVFRIGTATINYNYFIKAKVDDIRIYNRALSDAEIAALYGSNEIAGDIDYPPLIEINKSVFNQNEILHVNGANFTRNEQVRLELSGPREYEYLFMTPASDPIISYEVNTASLIPGTYRVRMTDLASRNKSNSFTIKILQPEINGNIEFANSFGNVSLNSTLIVSWKDYMSPAGYQLNGFKRKYDYNIMISYNNGLTWTTYNEQGYRDKLTYQTFKKTFAVTQLTNQAIVRIIDNIKPNRTIDSPVFSVTPVSQNINISYDWDYSVANLPFDRNDPNNSPIGVVADGVSRVLIKVANSDANRLMTNISVNLGANANTRTFGKLIPLSSLPTGYSEELDEQGLTSITRNLTGTNEFYMWYISPEDYLNEDNDKNLNERDLNIKFNITYQNSIEPEITKVMKIKRVPLILIHGLSDSKAGWANFQFNVNGGGHFNSSTKWIHSCPSISPFASFESNAQTVKNRIKDLLKSALKEHYAANQVDYVCHSMGGSVLRTLEETPAFKFYNDDEYKTYTKGFVHKFITLNTPHNGTPVANVAISKIIPFLNDYCENHNGIMNFVASDLIYYSGIAWGNGNTDFLLSVTPTKITRSWLFGGDYYYWTSSPALQNLQSGAAGITHTPSQNLKAHYIAGDLIAGYQDMPSIPQSVWNTFEKTDKFFSVVDKYLDLVPDVSPEIVAIKKIKNATERIYKTVNFLCKAYEVQNFLLDCDLIVPRSSQIPYSGYNSTVFNGWNNNHTKIRDNVDVGNKVFDLLHASLNSLEFATMSEQTNVVNQPVANTENPVRPNLTQSTYVQNTTPFTTVPTLNILTPSDSIYIKADSIMNISLAVSSTEGLNYKKIYFQENTILDTNAILISNGQLQISSNKLGKNTLLALASYTFADTSFVISKSLSVFIVPDSLPLSIEFNPNIIKLKVNEKIENSIHAIYKTNIVSINNYDSLRISINDTNIIKFKNNTFTANSEGITYAVAEYYGKTDTLWFEIEGIMTKPESVPVLKYPTNNSTSVSLTDTLKWHNPINTIVSNIQISTDSTFTNDLQSQSVVFDSVLVLKNLKPGTKYFWRAKAVGEGGESEWSNVWSFRTASPILTQNIPLTTGWNLISGYVTPQSLSIPTITSGITTQLKIMKNAQGQTYWPPFLNSLNTWNIQQAYMTNVNSNCTLSLTGQQVMPEQNPITFANIGWYWLPYFRTANQAPTTALASISGKFSLIKSITGQTYWPPFMNTLTNLEPNKGYYIYITSPTTLTYPANATQVSGKIDAAPIQAEPKYLLSDYSGTGNSATIAIEIDGAKSGDEFGVYTADGLLVGSAVYTGKATGVNIWGDNDLTTQKDGASENEELFVKLYKSESKSLSTLSIGSITNMMNNEKVSNLQYKANGIYLAKAKAEVSAVEESDADFLISPQPVRNEAVVTYNVNTDNAGIEIELYDLKGTKVGTYNFTSLSEGTNKLRLDVSNMPSGMYNVIIKSGAEVHQAKMIKVD